MEWIEMVHLRSYSQSDRDQAVAAFHQLTLMDQETGLIDIILLRDIALENDLCICVHRNGELSGRGKSPLGLQLAAAFAEYGHIHHSVWVNEGRVPHKSRRTANEANS